MSESPSSEPSRATVPREPHEVVALLTASPIWLLADCELSEHRFRVRWDHRTEQGHWAELTLTNEGANDVTKRWSSHFKGRVSWRDSTPADLDDIKDLARDVISFVEPLSKTSNDLRLWLGGPPSPHAGFDSETGILHLLATTWSLGHTLTEGWQWKDISRSRNGGWTLELSKNDEQHHVVINTEAPQPTLMDYRVGGVGGCVGEARARVQLALAFEQAPRSKASSTDRTPTPPTHAPVLGSEGLKQFHAEGYVVVPGAVSAAYVQAVKDAIHWFLELDPTFDGQWFYDIIPYANPMSFPGSKAPGFIRSGNFLEFYQHQALWDIRQSPLIHQVFSELWGQRDLWVSLDRVNMKPPVKDAPTDSWRDPGFVHWDVDTRNLPLPFGVQGLVALTDMGPEHGTFHCAPGFHHELEAWAEQQGPDRDCYRPDTSDIQMVSVSLKAGDLLVWHHGLPHGNGMNRSTEVRMVQYLSMQPAERLNRQARVQRIRAWRERLKGGTHFEGDPLNREKAHGKTATLTPLGRRLLGIEDWDQPMTL